MDILYPPSCGKIHPSPPRGNPPPLMAVKFTPPQPAVILHSCWRSNSTFSTQLASSLRSGGQPHPSPSSGHPPPLLAVKVTPLHPAVILYPCWWPTSLLPTRRSSYTPYTSTPPLLLVFQRERGREGRGLMKKRD